MLGDLIARSCASDRFIPAAALRLRACSAGSRAARVAARGVPRARGRREGGDQRKFARVAAGGHDEQRGDDRAEEEGEEDLRRPDRRRSSSIVQNVATFWRARFRLYRSRFLQEKTHFSSDFTAFFKIYKIITISIPICVTFQNLCTVFCILFCKT